MRCSGCDYELAGISGTTCPECGRDVTDDLRHGAYSRPVLPLLGALAFGLLSWVLWAAGHLWVSLHYFGHPFGGLTVPFAIAALLTFAGFLLTWRKRRALRSRGSNAYALAATLVWAQAIVVGLVWIVTLSGLLP